MKSTAQLLHQIKDCPKEELPDLDSPDFACPSPAIYMCALLNAHGLEIKDAIRALRLDRSYGYQLFNGTRHPTRALLIRLAALMESRPISQAEPEPGYRDLSGEEKAVFYSTRQPYEKMADRLAGENQMLIRYRGCYDECAVRFIQDMKDKDRQVWLDENGQEQHSAVFYYLNKGDVNIHASWMGPAAYEAAGVPLPADVEEYSHRDGVTRNLPEGKEYARDEQGNMAVSFIRDDGMFVYDVLLQGTEAFGNFHLVCPEGDPAAEGFPVWAAQAKLN